VKEVFAWDLLKAGSERVEACLVVQDVEVEVVFSSVNSVKNEHFLVNKQGQVEGFQELLSVLEMLLQLVVGGDLFAVGLYSEEIAALFAWPVLGFGDVESLVHSGVAMYPFPRHLLSARLLVSLEIVPCLLDQCSSAFAHP